MNGIWMYKDESCLIDLVFVPSVVALKLIGKIFFWDVFNLCYFVLLVMSLHFFS